MFSYTFTNLLAAPFSCSQACLSFDRLGSSLFIPSSSRVSCFHLGSSSSCSINSASLLTKEKRNGEASAAFDGAEEILEGAVSSDSGCKITTFPFEGRVDICHFCIRSDGLLAIGIDVHGQGLVINLAKGCIVNRIQFHSNTSTRLGWQAVKDRHLIANAAFSPDDRLFAVACGRTIQIWLSPEVYTSYQLRLLQSFALHQRPITSMSWSPDSVHLVTGSQDCTVRLWRVKAKPAVFSDSAFVEGSRGIGTSVIKHDECVRMDVHQQAQRYRTPADDRFVPSAFVTHRHELKFVCFSTCLRRIYSINREGVIITWTWQSKNEANELYGEGLDDKLNCAKQIHPAFYEGRREECRKARALGVELEKEKCECGVGTDDDVMRHAVVSEDPIDYSEGVWTMEKKAYCNQDKGQKVSHAASNVCPYYKYDANKRECGTDGMSQIPLPQYMVVGFTGGTFQLYLLPEFDVIVRLSLGMTSLDSLALSYDGEWIAAASSLSSTLIVWEWRSETYVLRQHSHLNGIHCICFSPSADGASAGKHRIGARAGDGGAQTQTVSAAGGGRIDTLGLGVSRGLLATGSADGKVKVWDAESGFCYCTFLSHTSAVTDLCFAPNGVALFSSSLDGTVQAYDLLRYKPFRVYTARGSQSSAGFLSTGKDPAAFLDSGVQFTSVAVDAGGEVLVAGSQGSVYSAFVWSVQTAKLLDELKGHEGPVSTLVFHPHPDKQGILVTGSWDKKIKVWDVFGRKSGGGVPETLLSGYGVLCLAFNPIGDNTLAVGGERGHIAMWDIDLGEEGNFSSIDCVREFQGGRKVSDRTAKNAWTTKAKQNVMGLAAGLDLNICITSLSFSSSGSLLLACSKTCPKVILCEAKTGIIISSFVLTSNRLLEGIFRELNSKYIADDGTPIQAYNLSDDDDDLNEGERERKRIKQHISLPGVSTGEMALKSNRIFEVNRIQFSADSRCFAVATSHGLFIYSIELNRGMMGNFGASQLGVAPPLLTRRVTTGNIVLAMRTKEYAKAFIYSLILSDTPTITYVYEHIPVESIPLVCSSLAPSLLPSFLFFLQRVLCTDVNIGTRHLQINLFWLTCLVKLQMHVFQGDPSNLWSETMIHGRGGGKEDRGKDGEDDESERKARAFDRLTSLNVDLRTLFLLVLRQLQNHYINLHSTFAQNMNTLAFINATVKRDATIQCS